MAAICSLVRGASPVISGGRGLGLLLQAARVAARERQRRNRDNGNGIASEYREKRGRQSRNRAKLVISWEVL